MTDYFALLDQPRKPWIDLNELEEKYHALARASHPDQSKKPTADFAEVNRAYRVLRDPKQRVEHLLALEGRKIASTTSEIPNDLAELFMEVASAMKTGGGKQITGLLTTLEQHFEDALQQLHVLSEKWNGDATALSKVEHLQQRFSFLTRWKDLLAERTAP